MTDIYQTRKNLTLDISIEDRYGILTEADVMEWADAAHAKVNSIVAEFIHGQHNGVVSDSGGTERLITITKKQYRRFGRTRKV